MFENGMPFKMLSEQIEWHSHFIEIGMFRFEFLSGKMNASF